MAVKDMLKTNEEFCTAGWAADHIKNEAGMSLSRQAIYSLIKTQHLKAFLILGESVVILTKSVLEYNERKKGKINIQDSPVNDVFDRFEQGLPADELDASLLSDMSKDWDDEAKIPSEKS